jgi:hypothetical protein
MNPKCASPVYNDAEFSVYRWEKQLWIGLEGLQNGKYLILSSINNKTCERLCIIVIAINYTIK